MDSSQTNLQAGQKVSFISGEVVKFDKPHCIQFYYWLLGDPATQGTLTVGYKMDFYQQPVWKIRPTQERKWMKAEIDIEPQQRSYYVYFEATVGVPLKSNMAIDDVNIFTGRCEASSAKSGECASFQNRN